jgi:hypothetical protein
VVARRRRVCERCRYVRRRPRDPSKDLSMFTKEHHAITANPVLTLPSSCLSTLERAESDLLRSIFADVCRGADGRRGRPAVWCPLRRAHRRPGQLPQWLPSPAVDTPAEIMDVAIPKLGLDMSS